MRRLLEMVAVTEPRGRDEIQGDLIEERIRLNRYRRELASIDPRQGTEIERRERILDLEANSLHSEAIVDALLDEWKAAIPTPVEPVARERA